MSDRTQKISKILNKLNERFHLLYEWLACEEYREEYLRKLSEKGGRDTHLDPLEHKKL